MLDVHLGLSDINTIISMIIAPQPGRVMPEKGVLCPRSAALLWKFNGAPRVWAEKKYFVPKILMKQPHDCSY